MVITIPLYFTIIIWCICVIITIIMLIAHTSIVISLPTCLVTKCLMCCWPLMFIILLILDILGHTFFPNKCLGHLVPSFCPCVVLLMWNHVVVTSFGPKGCGGDIGSPFRSFDLLINVIKTIICWPIQMLPVNVGFKYVLRGVVLKLDLWV
jgi:hypothetical protein